MDGIFLGIAGDGRDIFRYRKGDVKREMGHEDKRGNEGEREGRRVRESGCHILCIKNFVCFVHILYALILYC